MAVNQQQNGGYSDPFSKDQNYSNMSSPNQNYSNDTPTQDKAEWWMKLISFFIPVIGLILYIVWKDSRPLTAKSCGKCALMPLLIYFGLLILCLIIFAAV